MLKLSFVVMLLLSLLFPKSETPTEKSPSATGTDIPEGSLKDVGMDSTLLQNMTKEIESGSYPNVHSVLVMKNGRLVYERYFAGKDEILGDPIGMVKHSKETLHDLRSVSKSVVSACIGIAIAKGKIKSVDQSVFEFFPEYNDLKTPQKSKLTVKHLLSMSCGLEWNENIPYSDPNNFEIKMEKSPDPVRFVLSQKIVNEPGKVWNYNGGSTEILAAIIFKTTGLEVDEFARQNLFNPLGIQKFAWTKFPTQTKRKSIPAAASGLRLTSRDILKFGMLYMNKGLWQDKEILPESWVTESHKSQLTRETLEKQYGYQFWLENEKIGNHQLKRAAAVGNGGQRIFFDHQNDLLVVTTAGVYNQWNIKNNTDGLLLRFVYPSFLK